MATINTNFGTGGANLVPQGAQGIPTLAEVLRDIADDLAALGAGGTWSGALPVVANVLTLPAAGTVIAVDATVGVSVGPKLMSSGAPLVGHVQVAYVAGVATLTFNAADAITAAKVIYLPAGAIKTIKG